MTEPTSTTQAAVFPSVGYETWRDRVVAELGGSLEERLGNSTLEGIPVEPLYVEATGAGLREPLPRLVRQPGPWRIWQEVPVDGGGLAGSALAREADRDLG